MIRDDLVNARQAWVDAAGDDENERTHREKSDFLAQEDAEGRKLDFMH
jgi:hypothetical protein